MEQRAIFDKFAVDIKRVEMVNDPMFSIITVTRNASATIGLTLRSVASQTCRLFEYIIVDGASTDSTVSLVNSSGIANMTVISEPDNGIYDAMNKGLAVARGEYLIFLNAGDAFHSPGTLQHIADVAMDNDFPGIIYGQTDVVDTHGRRLGERHLRAPEVLTLDSFREGMTVCHQAFVALRRLAGRYDLRYRFSADYDWAVRCLQRSRRNKYIDDVLIDYLNEGMTTRNRYKSLKERFRIMCHYYGTFNTVVRHIRFFPRYIRRRKLERGFNATS